MIALMRALFAGLIAFLITFYLIPIFLRIAFKLNILDMPDGKIKVHKQPIPYLGGVAIYVGFITTLALTLPFENKITLFIIGSTLLLFIGLIDDLIRINPWQKFLGQMIATLCFLKGGLHLKENFFLNNYWNIPISYFWILSVVNSFNLVDIMDGLATTLATWCAIGFIVIALILNQGTTLVLLLAFLGSLLGFLWYNYPPAKIYLGDAGSLFIGGFLAVIPFLFNWGVYSWYGYLAPMVILGIPLLEVSSLVVIRFYKKIPFYQGSPDHFALYLKSNGWSVKNILIYVSMVSGILILTALALFLHIISIASFVMIALLYLMLWVVVLMNFSKNILKLPLFAQK